MITNNFLNKHTLASRWGYHTFGYGFDITFWERLEIGYVMALFDGKRHPNPSPRDMLMVNQDRHFAAKILVLKEEEFDITWLPALAIGVSDPVSGYGGGGSYIDGSVSTEANGFFNRMYAVVTKHFPTSFGVVAAHAGYQYNLRMDPRYNGPCAAVSWNPIWLEREWLSTQLVAEYDARTFNMGLFLTFWRHFDVMFDLQALKWASFGIRYKVILKSVD